MLQYRKVPLNQLKFDPRNARKHSQKNLKAIKDSLMKFGQQKPIVVGEDFTVIAGNGTLQAAKELGWETIDVHMSTLKKDEAIAFGIADNRSAELAEWDDSILGDILSELDGLGWDLEGIGFDADDVDDLIGGKGGNEGLTDPDAVPEIEQNIYGVKRGDIWILGNHRLMCGDSTQKEDVEKLMKDEKADLVFTDPPYNVGYKGSDGQEIQNDKMSSENFAEFCQKFYKNYFELLKEGGTIYVFHSDSMRHIFTKEFIDAGFHYSGTIIWNKNSLNLGRFDYHMKHEPCLYGWKPGKSHAWYSDRKQTTVFDFDKPSKNDLHPTMKPVGLVEYFLSNSSKNNNLIVDLFTGSGSTLIASEKLGRKFYGMELDTHYCSVIIKRWEEFTGQKAIKTSENHEVAESETVV